ncbi:hypothetical protein SAMN05421810_103323 [Amycolatopsis arida]|uniref:Uncharacterized protein n=1 Tax=Amycolatopsis arida TaxID=587909 RepID=A0A1I5SYL7_9PSEU|nr:hypothetical protein [Amycolatopsis arida]TDX96298.1 hypothetical protein CLV69_103435 [Amycolatopsis arida]SFP75808.1 hypothetical protein SAMN05421810_103323 [Amycolatopsis arida]
MTSSPEQRAVDTETALRRLIDRGYRFVHPRDARGEVVAVVGIRAHGSVIDMVRLEAEDDVIAMRMPGDEADVLEPKTVLWRSSGDLRRVVGELLSLGDDEYAVSRGHSSGCWVPDDAGRSKFLVVTA